MPDNNQKPEAEARYSKRRHMKSLDRWVVGALAVMCLATGLGAQGRGTTTVILVRHAEKAAAPADDPPLTAAGEARAKDLLDAVRDARVTAIVTTQLVRAKSTA